MVEVTQPWPEGGANYGFVKKLVGYGKPKIREQIGRRYATILRDKNVRISVNGDPCLPFQHCVWGPTRFVERAGHGQIPAVFNIDKVLTTQRRCIECGVLVPSADAACAACGSASIRTLEHRVHGWVGIQRFDDPDAFGIDLIRNGRAIRIAEKSAFFEFTDELKSTIKDYPIDSPYGRIVGEIHLDHVPVDFQKQDFQRSTDEWRAAMVELRGESSLQPTQLNADSNRSPVFQLFQGYRRVRVPGTRDMYMGIWDSDTDKPKRVSREVEREYYRRFLDREAGYHQDTEWWKLVEQADRRPPEDLVDCPQCQAQNLKGSETCQVCGAILIGKECVNEDCHERLPLSAVSCPVCGTSQLPDFAEPWGCQVCGEPNEADADMCAQCGLPRGTPNPTAKESLLANSDLDDDLSWRGCTVELGDGGYSQPLDVDVRVTRGPMVPLHGGKAVPAITFRGESLEIFLDKKHEIFRFYRLRAEEIIAAEIAHYLYDRHQSLVVGRHRPLHSVSALIATILSARWSDVLADSPDRVGEDIGHLFDGIRERLAAVCHDVGPELFDELTEVEVKDLVDNLLAHDESVADLGELKASGRFLQWISEGSVVSLFARKPELFFDGNVWATEYAELPDVPAAVLSEYQDRLRSSYLNCLEDCRAFLRYRTSDLLIALRARASVDYLVQKLA